MIEKSTLTKAIEQILENEGRVSAALVPGVFALDSDEPPAKNYHLRHRIEAVRRIRATADINARALVSMLGEDYDAAKSWANDLAVKMKHDEFVLSGLAREGIDEAQIWMTPPFASTVAMFETLLRATDTYGSLPAVAHAVFHEWNAARAVAGARDEARQVFGAELLRSLAVHFDADGREDRTEQMIDVAHRLIVPRANGVAHFLSLLRLISAFYRAYLTELYAFAATQIEPRRPAAPQR